MGTALDTHQLVRLAQTGDTEAFGKLYDLHLDAVYRFVYFRVGNRPDAEDVTEQIFVSMFESIHRYTSDGKPFEAWMYKIARNKIIDYYRTRKTHVALDAITDLPDHQASPEEITEQQLTKETVMQSLTKIPRQYQEMIILKFIEDKENEEISILLDKPVAHVRVLQHRAIQSLRTAIQQYG